MKITANEEYGLRVMLQLVKILRSKELAEGRKELLVTLNDIAIAEDISTDYVAQILLKLRRAELVDSVRGKNGGYKLLKAAEEISLFEVMQALSDEAYGEDFCENHSGRGNSCTHKTECSIRPVWSTISSMVNNYFKSIKLADLLSSESCMNTMLEASTNDNHLSMALKSRRSTAVSHSSPRKPESKACESERPELTRFVNEDPEDKHNAAIRLTRQLWN